MIACALGSYFMKSWARRWAASSGPMVPMSGTWQEMQRSTRNVSPRLASGNAGKICCTWMLKPVSL